MRSRTWIDADDPTVTLTEQTTILPPPPRSPVDKRLDRLEAWCNSGPLWHGIVGWSIFPVTLAVFVLALWKLPDFWNGAIYGVLMAIIWPRNRRFVVILVGFLAGMELAFYVAGLLW